MGNPVVHFEMGAVDDQRLARFYGELFGWSVQTVPGANYTVVDTKGGGGINGGIGRSQTGEPWSTFYVEVDDLQAVLDKAASLGGRTEMPIVEVPGMVTFAMFSDPDGLLVGLVRSEPPREGPPRALRPATAPRSTGSRSSAPTPSGHGSSTPSCSAGR